MYSSFWKRRADVADLIERGARLGRQWRQLSGVVVRYGRASSLTGSAYPGATVTSPWQPSLSVVLDSSS